MKYVGLQTNSGQQTKTSKSRPKSRPDSSKNRSSAPKKKREKSQAKTHSENKPDKQEVRSYFFIIKHRFQHNSQMQNAT